jgi:hypothetical protein
MGQWIKVAEFGASGPVAAGSVTTSDYLLTGPTTAIAAPPGSTLHTVNILQDGTGGRAVTWHASYLHQDSLEPDMRAGKRSVYAFVKAGSNYLPVSMTKGI